MQSKLLQALDLAGPVTFRQTRRPPLNWPQDTPPGPADLYAFRDTAGIPHRMLDPVTTLPMAQPLKVAIFNRTQAFEHRLDAPPYEVYDADVFERLMRLQRCSQRSAAFQPISPLTRQPIITIGGIPATQPDDALRAEIEAFLPRDRVVWEKLTPTQRAVVISAIALLDTPPHAAMLRVLLAPPNLDDRFGGLFKLVTAPERLGPLDDESLDHDALARYARLEHDHWHGSDTLYDSDESDDESDISSAPSFSAVIPWGAV